MSMFENINKELDAYGIVSNLEKAHFLAQADHESAGFKRFSESANYTFKRAKEIWPMRAKAIEAKQQELSMLEGEYCPQPWLFNFVYGSRMGNELNGTNDDDGYNYRGAGIFMLTGYSNYNEFVKWLNDPAIISSNVRKYCLTEDGAIKSAIWFWLKRNVSEIALRDDIVGVTRAINGGVHGLEQRTKLLVAYKKLYRVK
jgi:putative chitinase